MKDQIKEIIESLLNHYVRERDNRFKRGMEVTFYIKHLFDEGTFKTFDVVQSAQEMKALIFNQKKIFTSIENVWTYHSKLNDDIILYIAITEDGQFIWNELLVDENSKKHDFELKYLDIEDDFAECVLTIEKIKQTLEN